ncbi:putative DUF895 domain membrane protein [Gregarina niphandrodes]|uniref:DUF895 domain membrane protein n=1 Tax=Gregarina niphandrodes TaxID=110365 RepID=A0A023B689_GRENI|nr:putative DUF895 domain membrane protein [Gregarina niphandrodes]EZG65860.1 putative DUF895 domain membrane protein [Gregarina niphandrodes]|eukprot:XP_011134056.1 putative DUF895 domain membrane protein [Gregarina niphandrodes]
MGWYPSTLQLEAASVQVSILSIITFGGLGIHDALAQGQDASVFRKRDLAYSQLAYHLVSAFFSFFITPFLCQIGVRKLTLLATILSCIEGINEAATFSWWNKNTFSLIITGFTSSLASSLLWMIIFAIVCGYSTPADRSRYIAISWSLMHLGGSINAVVNIPTVQYVRFISMTLVIVLCSIISIYFCMLLVEPALVVRPDGSYANTYKISSVGSVTHELMAIFRAANPNTILMLPTAVTSIWTRPIQLEYLTEILTPTQAKGNLAYAVYFLIQGAVVWLLPPLLDKRRISPKIVYSAGMLSTVLIMLLTVAHLYSDPVLDLTTTRPDSTKTAISLMAGLGVSDCLLSTFIMWDTSVLGQGNARKCVRVGSFFQGWQSVSGALAWLWTNSSFFTLKLHCWLTIFFTLLSFPLGIAACDLLPDLDGTVQDDDQTCESFYSLYIPS